MRQLSFLFSARAPEGALRLSARAPEGALRLSARTPEGALRLWYALGAQALIIASLLTGCSDSESPSSSKGADSAWCKAKAVIDEHCTACHDGEGSAGTPMGLTSYADLTADSAQFEGEKIYQRVAARIHDTDSPMPPQGGISADDLKLLDDWIEAGAKPGDDKTCSGANNQSQVLKEWPKDCDETYTLVAHNPDDPSQPYTFPANTEDHPQFYFDAPWGDEEVQALAMRPITDNKKILHHWILYQNAGGRAFVTGWAPGKDDFEPLAKDIGLFLPSGKQSLRLDMHYFNLGEDTTDQLDASGVEICVVKKDKFRAKMATVFEQFASYGVGLPPVLAPANAMNHSVTANCTVTATEPVHLLTASPHAHKLATHMKFTVKRTDGTEIVMHDGPFNFEEQQSYALPKEVILNNGDVVTTTCTYSNPTDQSVTFGEDTGNEMCFNFAVYYPMGALRCGGIGDLLDGILGGN